MLEEKNMKKNNFLHLKVTQDPEVDPELDSEFNPDPDPLVRGADPRIQTKMSRIPTLLPMDFLLIKEKKLFDHPDAEL
jgi:hypothetical protein